MALFYVDKQGDLLPIAIQLFQDPAEDNPVNPLLWMKEFNSNKMF